jgi:hypothetical protein
MEPGRQGAARLSDEQVAPDSTAVRRIRAADRATHPCTAAHDPTRSAQP